MCVFSIYAGISLIKIKPNAINLIKIFLPLYMAKPFMLIFILNLAGAAYIAPEMISKISGNFFQRAFLS